MKKFLTLFLLIITVQNSVFADINQNSSEFYKQQLQVKHIKFNVHNFIRAIKSGNNETVELFFKAGMRPDKRYFGRYIVGIPVRKKQDDIFYLFISAKLNPNLEARGISILSYAILKKNSYAVNKLIEAGADVNAKCIFGQKPLDYALYSHQADIAQKLIEAGAETNKNHQEASPLIIAIERKQPEVVEKLLEAGVDANKTSKGVTPLISAIKKRQPQIVRMLIESGADVNKTNNVGFWVGPKYANNPDLISNFEPTSRLGIPQYGPLDKTLPSPIFFAIQTKQPEIVIMLIDAGADVNYINYSGLKPLDTAIYYDQAEIAKQLVKAGATASSTTYVEYAKNSKDEKMRNLEIPLVFNKPLYKNVNFVIHKK